MEQRKIITGSDGVAREYIFFTVTFNNYRDVETKADLEVRDREEWAECECVLTLPASYSDTGAPTPLILSFHGAGGRVCYEEDLIGGLGYVNRCVDQGFAALDVCGSVPTGLSMGCSEHMFVVFKAYRYAIRHYNLEERVMVAGASMGGHTAMNFANMFPSLVLCAGLIYPRLNMDGIIVDGHYCIGTWDKTKKNAAGSSTHDRIATIYRFPEDKWCERNTAGLNPFRSRSFINAEGLRVTMPPCPIRIWQGTVDRTVDPVLVQEYVNSVRRGGGYIELHLLEGVGHKLHPIMREEIALWFRRFTD